MNCEDCKEQPAAVHLTRIVNGQKIELHLCMACANRRNIQFIPMMLPVEAAIKPGFSIASPSGNELRKCQTCNYTWGEFITTGFLGCTKCYESFQDLLTNVIAKNQGNVKHQGKAPKHLDGVFLTRRNLTALRTELDLAIKQENFEKAARLRDQIVQLEKSII